MSNLNKVMLIGRVGQDPEIRSTGNGNEVANLRIATSEKWKDRSGEKQERTEWHSLTIWSRGDSRGLVGVVEQYVKKGMLIYVEGKLQTRKWQDKNGNDRYTTEIVVSQLQMLSFADDKADRAAPAPKGRPEKTAAAAAVADKEEFDDDIPF